MRRDGSWTLRRRGEGGVIDGMSEERGLGYGDLVQKGEGNMSLVGET